MPGAVLTRHLILPERGTLLINTDLHGNREDFERLVEIYSQLCSEDEDAYWAILGDLVHGPSESQRSRFDGLYDYKDESWLVAKGVYDLVRARPSHVHFVLGNHDHGHVGGPRTQKFHDDEVAFLESSLDENQRGVLRHLFSTALLAVIAPCGLFLSHGCPNDSLRSLADLDALTLDPARNSPRLNKVLRSFLTAYGQSGEVAARLLDTVSREVGHRLTTVVHGHDKDEDGWFTEGDNQLCPVIFGARQSQKRYVVVDLAALYAGPEHLRDGVELRRLYA